MGYIHGNTGKLLVFATFYFNLAELVKGVSWFSFMRYGLLPRYLRIKKSGKECFCTGGPGAQGETPACCFI